jgi:2-methylcitrate dehydratase PrpD
MVQNMTTAENRTMTLSERIADFVVGFDLDSAPAPLVGIAETAFVDTVGVMLAGSREPAARKVADVVAAQGAAPKATVIGRQLRTSPEGAALANGTATQALDYDLSFMIGQSSAALIPGLLPLAETNGASPRDLIAALVVGIEVCGTLAKCFPTLSSEGGWHGTGVIGTIGAAAALARLARMPIDTIPQTIGIAASMASAVSVNFGTMTKPLHAGLAARNGLTAVFLGQAGFTGSTASLEGNHGFFPCFAQGLPWTTEPFDGLGRTYRLIDPGYKIKPFSCGGLMHCAIEAALAIRDEFQPRIEDIAGIRIGVSPHAHDRAIDAYPWSEDSSRFSLRYMVAYALIHGALPLTAFTEEGYDNDRVRALAQRCKAEIDDEFRSLTGSGYSPGRVTMTMADGTQLEKVVYSPTGARKTPMNAEKVHKKFLSCATRAIGESTALRLHDILSRLGTRDSLDDLWPMLAAGSED